MTPEQKYQLNILLSEFGNANFDCGEFNFGKLGVSEAYDKLVARAEETKKAVIEYIETSL